MVKRETICLLTGSPRGIDSQGRARPTPGAWNSTRVSHVHSALRCLPRHITGAGGKQKGLKLALGYRMSVLQAEA